MACLRGEGRAYLHCTAGALTPCIATHTLPTSGTLHLTSPLGHSLSPSAARAASPIPYGTRSYTYFPADPTPSVGGNGIGFIDAGEKDQAPLEAREHTVGDLLVYTSPPLDEDMYVIGTPKATLWVRCLSPRANQADFVVRLCDVDARGRSVNICDGVKRVGDFAALERDATGQFFKVEVDVYPVRRRCGFGFARVGRLGMFWVWTWPNISPHTPLNPPPNHTHTHPQTAARFARGHRLRVHVASAGFIRWERNTMAYGYPSFLPVRFEVLHGGGGGNACSVLALPVVPAAALAPSQMKGGIVA